MAKHNKLSKYKIERIAEMARSGYKNREIASRLKVGLSSVVQYKRASIPVRVRMSGEDMALAKELMESGITITETAGKFEVTELYLENKMKEKLLNDWKVKHGIT